MGERSLPHTRGFVLQLRHDADVGQGRLAGRVEHIVSGKATHFEALDELLAFIARVLDDLVKPRAAAP